MHESKKQTKNFKISNKSNIFLVLIQRMLPNSNQTKCKRQVSIKQKGF